MRTHFLIAGFAAALVAAADAPAQTVPGEAARAGQAGEAGRASASDPAASSAPGASNLSTTPTLTGALQSLPPPPELTIDQQGPVIAPPPALECRMACDLDIEDCLEGRGAAYSLITTPEGLPRLSVAREDALACGTLHCSEQC
jgi:hypothetical protein